LNKLDDNTSNYKCYIVTNRHVITDLKNVWLRFNPKSGEDAKVYESKGQWVTHPDTNIDVAVSAFNVQRLEEDGIQFNVFRSEQNVATIDQVKKIGITEGDFVYTLGFPMRLTGRRRNSVLVRSGVIARIRDVLDGDEKEFMIDSFIFPGNSGGPVVLKPEIFSIEGTPTPPKADLIGIVSAYLPYEDIAYSLQSGSPVPRVNFRENSGLALVTPVDHINETILHEIKEQQLKLFKDQLHTSTIDLSKYFKKN
jgi:hypothetical protein